MRQAGLKPKPHNSGVYWTRTQLPEKKSKKSPQPVERDPYDINQDGVVDLWEIILCKGLGTIIALGVVAGFFWAAAHI